MLPVSSINRFVAVILALVRTCAGVAGSTVAFGQMLWVAGVAGILALGYASLGARVAIQARLPTWREFAAPWRAR